MVGTPVARRLLKQLRVLRLWSISQITSCNIGWDTFWAYTHTYTFSATEGSKVKKIPGWAKHLEDTEMLDLGQGTLSKAKHRIYKNSHKVFTSDESLQCFLMRVPINEYSSSFVIMSVHWCDIHGSHAVDDSTADGAAAWAVSRLNAEVLPLTSLLWRTALTSSYMLIHGYNNI